MNAPQKLQDEQIDQQLEKAKSDPEARDEIVEKLNQLLSQLEHLRSIDDSPGLRERADSLRRKLNHIRYVK